MSTAPVVAPGQDRRRSREAIASAHLRQAARARRRRGWVGRGLFVAAILALLVLPSLVPFQPNRVDLDAILLRPSRAHLLGTDENGRDALARLLVGARATLGIGVAATVVAVMLGAALGALAGYYSGGIDAVLMRAVDFALAFPSLFAILLFTSFVAAGPVQLVLLIGLTGWMAVARLVRGNVRALRNAPYIEAAQAAGASERRIIVRHLLPNTGGMLFVATLVQLNRSILAEATLSFLGLGIQPPAPTWGNLLIGAQDFLYTAPWLAIPPGLAITLTLLVIYRLGMDRGGGTW